MSEWKRSHHEYAASALPVRTELGIDESQPRPTLEMARAMAMLVEGQDSIGADPYNAVGRHLGTRRAG